MVGSNTLKIFNSCACSDNNLLHSVGGGEQHLRDKFRIVRALVFGHFGEFNDGLIKLASDISRSIAHQHHRALGFKSVKGGLSHCGRPQYSRRP